MAPGLAWCQLSAGKEPQRMAHGANELSCSPLSKFLPITT